MLPPKPCDGLVAVRDVNEVRLTIEVSRKVYLTAAIAPFMTRLSTAIVRTIANQAAGV
jgi:hypothetical protein